jgi:Fe-S oxidoreductase/coenzyme F420-reducing hydrogenase delta subunit
MSQGVVSEGDAGPKRFEPKIVAFCCNWCSYAGADLAGVSRIQYPPNVRVIRIMCTGRLEPIFVLHALEKGADGVLVAGCHPGDCHYVSGNLEAEKKVDRVHRILKMLGIPKERMRLEWISASEGARFAQVMTDFTEQIRGLGPADIKDQLKPEPKDKITVDALVDETGAFDCVECGKCTTMCPIADINPDFAPRLVVMKAIDSSQATGEVSDEVLKEVWTCLTCAKCSDKCPYKVMYSEFIQGLREMAFDKGALPLCSQAGILHSISRLHTIPDLKQDRLSWIPDDLKVADTGEVLLWIGCAPYFDTVFEGRASGLLDSAKAAIKILNKAGITPAVAKDERCCGHDLFWAGDTDSFQKLADLNVDIVKKSGAKKVVFICPEGYRTFKQDYSLFVGDLEFEVMHFTEFLAQLVKDGKLKFKDKIEESVTYHDGCRLGRHMGVYEEPRSVLSAMNADLKEMKRNREECPCCGVNAWLNCTATSKQMQVDRLMEGKETGADKMLVACPKCLIHFQCAGDEKVPVDEDKVDIPLEDYTTFIARYIE